MPPRSFFTMNEKTRFMLALIAPAVLALVFFQVVPILAGANTSFRDWSLHDPQRTWVGLANYAHVLRDPEFVGIVLPNTFGFMAASVAGSLVCGLLIALMLNKRFAGRDIVQSFVLLPLMVAPVIAAIMIRWMFNDQFGVVDAVVRADPAGRAAEPAARAIRSGPDRCRERLAHFSLHHAADAAARDGGLHRHPFDRRLPHLRHRVDDLGRRAGARHGSLQHLRLRGVVPVPQSRPRLRRCRDRGAHHRGVRVCALPHPQPLRGSVAIMRCDGLSLRMTPTRTASQSDLPLSGGGGKKVAPRGLLPLKGGGTRRGSCGLSSCGRFCT